MNSEKHENSLVFQGIRPCPPPKPNLRYLFENEGLGSQDFGEWKGKEDKKKKRRRNGYECN
ncbi:MAG: hypothetical protein IJ794_00340 [Lachnospiraceae bacterium]|nr:hypothetical protein [Lachnospiraceae bacterium]